VVAIDSAAVVLAFSFAAAVVAAAAVVVVAAATAFEVVAHAAVKLLGEIEAAVALEQVAAALEQAAV